MRTIINGHDTELVAVTDRGLGYGDGLFETILIQRGRPILVREHLNRLARGLKKLNIKLEESVVTTEINKILSDFKYASGVLKLVITRGSGGRGYRAGQLEPTRILSIAPYQPPGVPAAGIKVFVCRQRLAEQAQLAGLKHLNRLEQVLASLEWPDESFQEGLMLSTAGLVIEGTKSNLLLSTGGQWITPDLTLCGIEGVFREHLLERWQGRIEVAPVTMEDILKAEECLFCNSLAGVMPVASLQLESSERYYSPGRLCQEAAESFADLLA